MKPILDKIINVSLSKDNEPIYSNRIICDLHFDDMDHQGVEQLPGSNGQDKKDQIHRSFQRYCRDIRARLDKYSREYNVCENFDGAVKYLVSRPVLLAGVIAVIFSIAIPILLFTLFAITTVACTFTGFIIVEGTILAFGTVVLCGLLLSLITSIILLAMCLALAYYTCFKTYSVIKRI